MLPLRPSTPCLRYLQHLNRTSRPHVRSPRQSLTFRPLSTSASRRQPTSAIPYTQTCPSPTCPCASTPPDLDIDRKTPLLHTAPSYAQHVLISTGKDDWSSRIDDEGGPAGDFLKGIKNMIGKGGESFDPFNNILLTMSSLPASENPDTTTALLFPSFKRIRNIPHTPSGFSALATAYLKAKTLHPMHDKLSPEQKARLTRDESAAEQIPPAEPIDRLTVLICGHGERDSRCGILGPLLRSGFQEEFKRRGIDADVGLISHIGGHKFAGNVIMYIPPGFAAEEGKESALAGCGVWYGRVGPENVEGVVEETVRNGKVVGELFRGGVMADGGVLSRVVEAQREKDEGRDKSVGATLRPRARG